MTARFGGTMEPAMRQAENIPCVMPSVSIGRTMWKPVRQCVNYVRTLQQCEQAPAIYSGQCPAAGTVNSLSLFSKCPESHLHHNT
ncbi:hypothetical protein DV515_00008434 [Chloebia gouldiae]|uniref:Uncharacterized protein n=1 Tax=Chloebia gouldiae TaxID=44316 RepID=A0A3L8SF01_CHLGU|nr:hypothetical protein DV515_00008434 [Chloebia gouldiae]